MSIEKVDTLIVGAGQAGIAMSEHLGNNGVPHLVLEKNRVAEAWRSGRWDMLVANGPAWHDRFPNLEFTGLDPDAFPAKERIADYLVDYANLPQDPTARQVLADPDCLSTPIRALDLGCRRHVDHLGDRISSGFQLDAGRYL